MTLTEQVQSEINRLIETIKNEQSEDGSWRYCFESGPMTDAYTIMVLRILEYNDENLIDKLVNRLLKKQHSNGAWKLYDDDEGNLSATVEAYTALLYSGYFQTSDLKLKMAEEYILKNGGLEQVHVSTKFMLALHDLYPWPTVFPIPILLINSPKFLPISFFKFSSYVRSHFAPLLIVGHNKYTTRNRWTPNLQHLFLNNEKYKKIERKHSITILKLPLFKMFFKIGIKRAEQYMIQSIEKDGTLSSYASATFFMVYALLSLGYKPTSPMIQNAVKGIISFLYKSDEQYHIQNSPSTIWDTALISYALQKAGLSENDKTIQSASNYLLSFQHKGIENNSDSLCTSLGGWSFSEYNTHNPDVDDTQAVLRSITNLALYNPEFRAGWNSGVKWLLEMQNKDGGWASFEKNSNKSLVSIFPIQNFVDTVIDSSTADLTGRTLEFLGNYLKMDFNHQRIKDGVNWLIRNQKEDGSWYGRWGISYIYGTWAAVTGMKAVGVPSNHPSIQKAIDWLLSKKNSDGGWGESCKSDISGEYIPLPYSTLVHTSWALDTLITVFDSNMDEINEGILNIISWMRIPDNRITYPTGGGLPGHFYIYYHSYQYIWPLLTLSHYKNKFK